MIIATSLRALVRRRSRTALALAGIAVSAALLVDMTMLSSGLTKSFVELTRAQGYGLRVTPRGTLPFDSEAGIRGAAELRSRIEALDGVRAVAPVLGAQLYPVRGGEAGQTLFATGIDPEAQMLYVLLQGTEPGPREVVVSEPLAAAYELRPGSSIDLAVELDVALGRPRDLHSFRVSGIGDFIYDHSGQRSAALRLAELQEMTGRPDEVSLFGVATNRVVDEEAVAIAAAAISDQVSVYSAAELMGAMDQRLLYFRQLSTILGAIALAVAALLVATVVTIGVRERFGEIAALRAIGVPARRIQAAIVAEGLVLTAIGCLAGAPIGWRLARFLDRILLEFPGIPARVSFFVFDPAPAAAALGAVLLVGALAGLIPGFAAVRAPLGTALREEAD